MPNDGQDRTSMLLTDNRTFSSPRNVLYKNEFCCGYLILFRLNSSTALKGISDLMAQAHPQNVPNIYCRIYAAGYVPESGKRKITFEEASAHCQQFNVPYYELRQEDCFNLNEVVTDLYNDVRSRVKGNKRARLWFMFKDELYQSITEFWAAHLVVLVLWVGVFCDALICELAIVQTSPRSLTQVEKVGIYTGFLVLFFAANYLEIYLARKLDVIDNWAKWRIVAIVGGLIVILMALAGIGLVI